MQLVSSGVRTDTYRREILLSRMLGQIFRGGTQAGRRCVQAEATPTGRDGGWGRR